MIRLLLAVLLGTPLLAQAMTLRDDAANTDEGRVSICYNYGCKQQEDVRYPASTLDRLGRRLAAARSAAEERALIAEALGRLYRVAATQTPVGADRSGNFLDAGADGRMDCIDHSTSTTRLLQLLEARGGVRFHRVVEPARRTSVIFQHFSAVIEELSLAERLERLPPGEALAGCNCTEDGLVIEGPDGADVARPGERYAVDSWFVDNGEPAVVLPLAEWLNGGGPNVQ